MFYKNIEKWLYQKFTSNWYWKNGIKVETSNLDRDKKSMRFEEYDRKRLKN